MQHGGMWMIAQADLTQGHGFGQVTQAPQKVREISKCAHIVGTQMYRLAISRNGAGEVAQPHVRCPKQSPGIGIGVAEVYGPLQFRSRLAISPLDGKQTTVMAVGVRRLRLQ